MREIREMNYIVGILSIVMLLVGCKKTERQSGMQDGVVRFTAYQSGMSKVTGVNFDPKDEISIFAPLAGNRIDGEYEVTLHGQIKDKRYIADNRNNFSPKTETDEIRYRTSATAYDYYVLYPAVSPQGATVDTETFQVALGDIADQRKRGAVLPYLYSNNAKGQSVANINGGFVALTFRHIFSKISVELNYDREIMPDTLTRIEFSAANGLYREVVVDLMQDNDPQYSETAYQRIAVKAPNATLATENQPYLLPVPPKGSFYTEGYILPGITANAKIRIVFGNPDLPDTDPKKGIAYNALIPTNITRGVFEAGKAYHYRLEIVGGEVTIGGTIEDWETVGNDDPIFEAR